MSAVCLYLGKEYLVTEEIVIFDIDGTLADVSERIHHVKKKPKNWNAFFQGMAQDKAIHSMVRLCNILYDVRDQDSPVLRKERGTSTTDSSMAGSKGSELP